MHTRSENVRQLIVRCCAWYEAQGEDIRQLTERAEELWYEMDDLERQLQDAEMRCDAASTDFYLNAILRQSLRIHEEAAAWRSQTPH